MLDAAPPVRTRCGGRTRCTYIDSDAYCAYYAYSLRSMYRAIVVLCSSCLYVRCQHTAYSLSNHTMQKNTLDLPSTLLLHS